MYARIAIGLMMLVAMSQRLMAEEDRSVESPEAFRAICDKAMPDLLKGKTPEIFRKVAPDAMVDSATPELRTKFEPFRGEYGDPVDWIFAGVRKRGNTFRQYVYLCRYANRPLVWRLTAMRTGERWRLASFTFDSNATNILVQASPAASDSDGQCAQIGDKIVDALAHVRSEAVDLVTKNAMRRDSDSAAMQSLRSWAEQTMALVLLDGSAVTCDPVEMSSVCGVLARRCYVVQCSRGIISISLLFYRPGDDWKVIGWDCHPSRDAEDMFVGARLEPNAAPQTARAPKSEERNAAMPKPR